jgi:hypothetical protein
MSVERFPLSWPVRWKRTPAAQRRTAAFSKIVETRARDLAMGVNRVTRAAALSPSDAALRLDRQITALGGRDAILSTNLRLRLDGLPTIKQGEPEDPGAAVYFSLQGKPLCLASDRWLRTADNIAALAAHIDALRRIDRYGVGSLAQAFAGYTALPPSAGHDWWLVLGVSRDASLDDIERAFRTRAQIAHPDRPGGSTQEFARLSEARTAARAARQAARAARQA